MRTRTKRRIAEAVWFLAVAAAAVLTAPGFVLAGGYYSSCSYAAPSYYSTYTPSYSYAAPSYHTEYVTKYVDRDVLYPYPVKAYINPDYYFSTQDYYRDKLLVDAMAGRTVQLLQGNQPTYQGYSGFQIQAGQQVMNAQQIQALVQQLQQGQPPAAQPAPQPPSIQPPTAQPPAMPPAALAPAPPTPGPTKDWRECWYGGQGDAADPVLVKSVQDNCLTCHGGTNPARIDLRDLGRISFVGRSLVKSLVDDGTMPKNAHPLSNDDAAKFQAWFAAGYKAAVAKK